jgi:hypothetical protein
VRWGDEGVGGEGGVQRQKLQVSTFAPYWSKSLQMFSLSLSLSLSLTLSLSFHRKHICLTKYVGEQKSTSSGVPIHTCKWVLLLAMQALLITLIELFLLITSVQLVEEN